MARTATALEYRPVVAHNGVVKNVVVVLSSGKTKRRPVIFFQDGTSEPRLEGSGSQAFREKVIARDSAVYGPMCRYCGVNVATTVDHIKPWSMVGDYRNGTNGAACCASCNKTFNNNEYVGLKTREKVTQLLRENAAMGSSR